MTWSTEIAFAATSRGSVRLSVRPSVCPRRASRGVQLDCSTGRRRPTQPPCPARDPPACRAQRAFKSPERLLKFADSAIHAEKATKPSVKNSKTSVLDFAAQNIETSDTALAWTMMILRIRIGSKRFSHRRIILVLIKHCTLNLNQ